MPDVTSGRCQCPNCTTGRCHCEECREGPGIDFRAKHAASLQMSELVKEIARERIQIRELRAPKIDRKNVRRWGEITTTTTRTDRGDQDVRTQEGRHGGTGS